MARLIVVLLLILCIGVNIIHTKNALTEEDTHKIEDILPHYEGADHLDSFDQTLFLGGQVSD